MAPTKWFDPMGIYAKEDEEIEREKSPPPGTGPTRADLRKIAEAFRPTKADLERVYTEDELRELCSHAKVKVRMNWFNPVETFMRRWRKEGRVQRWPRKTLIRMLNKAILRNDEYMSKDFSRKDFDDEREFERRKRTRFNNVYLDGWHRGREEANKTIGPIELTGSDVTIIENTPMVVNTETAIHFESINIDNTELAMESFSEDDSFNEDDISSSAETELRYFSKGNSDEIVKENSNLSTAKTDMEKSKHAKDINDKIENKNSTIQSLESSSEEDDISSTSETEVGNFSKCKGNEFDKEDRNLSTAKTDMEKSKHAKDIVYKIESTNSTIQSFNNYTHEIYTESMFETDLTFDTQSQPQTVPNSEILPYEMFGSQIPLTSTQSQSQSQH